MRLGILSGEPRLGMDQPFHAHLLPIQSSREGPQVKTHGQKDHHGHTIFLVNMYFLKFYLFKKIMKMFFSQVLLFSILFLFYR